MAFYSMAFLCFIVIFVCLHEIAGNFFPKYQWVVRLIAGVSFFFLISGYKIVFLLISAFTVWGGAIYVRKIAEKNKYYRKNSELTKEEKKLSKKKCQQTQKIYIFFIIAINLVFLITVKYLFPVFLNPIALPLGISFYTLQAISYLVDVYGEKYEPQQNFGKLLLFLCWFPQLIQGPINRYDLINTDLYKTYRINARDFRYAFYIFLFGAIKKYAIGDLLAPIVNSALNDNSGSLPGSFVLFGAVLFAIEQYADFSGGIDMAMGASLLFGVRLNENFRQPYFSTSLAEFWRRWHISLGSWMRDYVFYPFVTTKPVANLTKLVSNRFGNHAGRALTGGISNLIVFSLVGLWHGPDKHYLAWGLYNGIIIALSDALAPAFSSLNRLLKINEKGRFFRFFRILRTFTIIVFAGYFDVIGPIRTGLSCFINTFFHFELAGGGAMINSLFTDNITSVQAISTVAVSVVLLFINSLCKEGGHSPLERICSHKYYIRWIVCFSLIMILLYSFTVSSGIRGFMYAAF